MHDFLRAEPQWGLQLLTSNISGLQSRLIETWRKLFEEQIKAGLINPEMDADSLAYFIIRIGEGAIYCDLICGLSPTGEWSHPLNTWPNRVAVATPAQSPPHPGHQNFWHGQFRCAST